MDTRVLKTELVDQLTLAINHQDIAAIKALLSADHRTINALGIETVGQEPSGEIWKNYFDYFPDYHIEVEKLVHHGNTVVLMGVLSGTLNKKFEVQGNTHFKIPAAWRIVIQNDKLSIWQQYSDMQQMNELIQKAKSLSSASSKKITGLGGVFLKSKEPKALCAWYDAHLGTNFGTTSYSTFRWRERDNYEQIGRTEFSIFPEQSNYFEPSQKEFMLNLRVAHLDSLLQSLREKGVEVMEKIERLEYGNFAWIIDLEGNKIELWEPIDKVLEDYDQANK